MFMFGGSSAADTSLWVWTLGPPGSGGGFPPPAAAAGITTLGAAAGAGIAFASLTSLAAFVLTAILYRRLTAGPRAPSAAAMGSVYEGL